MYSKSPRQSGAILNQEISEEPIVDGKSLGGAGEGGHLLGNSLRLHLRRHLQSHRVRLKFVQLLLCVGAGCIGLVSHLTTMVSMAPELVQPPFLHEVVVPQLHGFSLELLGLASSRLTIDRFRAIACRLNRFVHERRTALGECDKDLVLGILPNILWNIKFQLDVQSMVLNVDKGR